MAFTTVADLKIHTDVVYTLEEEARLVGFLDSAERWLVRQVGRRFYDAADRDADESKDWIEATVLLTDQRWRLAVDAAARAALTGPYQSEKMGDYSYTLRSDLLAPLTPEPRVREIIDHYRPGGGPDTLQQGAITYRDDTVEVG